MHGQEADVGAGNDQDRRRLDVLYGSGGFGDAQLLQVVLVHVAAHDNMAVADFIEQATVRRLAGVQRMAAATVEPQSLVVEGQVGQPRYVQGKVADGQVQSTVQHALFQFRRGADVDMQVGVMPARDKTLGGARQRRTGVGQGGVDDAEVELATDVLLEHVGVHAEALHGAEQAQGGLMDGHALLGKAKTAAPALAELDPEAGFQVSHLFADGRLTRVQCGLRCGKATAPDDGGEYSEELQIDIVELDHRGLPAGRHIAKADMNVRALFFFPS